MQKHLYTDHHHHLNNLCILHLCCIIYIYRGSNIYISSSFPKLKNTTYIYITKSGRSWSILNFTYLFHLFPIACAMLLSNSPTTSTYSYELTQLLMHSHFSPYLFHPCLPLLKNCHRLESRDSFSEPPLVYK